MDFVDPLENEAPPPMDTSYVAEHARQVDARRRAALDPELFGDATEPGEPDEPRAPGRYSPLTARLTARAMHRGLDLIGYERGPLSSYMLPVGAAGHIGLDYYPAAHVLNDGLAHLGVQLDVTHSVLVESQGANDNSYPTTALSWQLGLRYRAILDDAGSEVAGEAAMGQQSFVVERGHLGDPSPEGAPNVGYTYARVGGAGRFRVGDFFLGVRAAYLPALDVGRIGAELGGASAHGAELGFSFAVPIAWGLSFLASLDGRVYVISATPNPESRSSASGAVDRFIGLNAGLEWRMPSEAEL